MEQVRLGLKFIYGLSALGLVAIISRVARNTFEVLLMEDVGPAVMALVSGVGLGIRNFFRGIFADKKAAAPEYAQAA